MPVPALIERESEIGQLEQALDASARGEGRVVLISGPAGAGKSALSASALELARTRGATVASARGGELEGDLPFGIVRQLFEARLGSATAQRRAELLAGAAQLAAPLFEQRSGGDGVDGAALVHGLYWLVANVAAAGPLVVAIDDLHWADPPSLRFVAYLVRRLEGLAVLVLLCARSDEPAADGSVLAEVLAAPGLERIVPPPLSDRGVAEILTSTIGRAPDPSFATACREATSGTPLLVHALAAELRATGVEPVAETAARVADVGPRAVGHATMLRLARLHPQAATLARAIAVLGSHAHLPRVVRLADVAREDALEGLDALIAGGVIEAGPPLTFTHPILRTAVYNGLAPGERSLAHSRAADLMASEGLTADAVATHLLATEPCGSADVVERLRAAARDARAGGAPETAAVYLRRALAEEPARATRAELLYELATAENMVRRADCAEHFMTARDLLADPAARARCALQLANVLVWMGRADESFAALEAGIVDAVAAGDGEATALRTAFVNHGMYYPSQVAKVDELLGPLRAIAETDAAPPDTLLVLASLDVMRGDDVPRAVAMVKRALNGRRPPSPQAAGLDALTAGLVALAFADELHDADELLDAMAEDAHRRGTASAFLVTCGLRECVLWRRGDVAGAEDELQRSLAIASEHELALPIVFTLYYGLDALVERDGLEDIAERAMALELPPALRMTVTGAWLAEVRAALLLARGQRAAAVAALAPCKDIYTPLRMQPTVSAWRSLLASASAPDDPERARELAVAELADACRVGRPRATGIALRRLGLIEGGGAGLDRLREAEAVLRPSTARLEHARALVDPCAAPTRAPPRAIRCARVWTSRPVAVRRAWRSARTPS